MTLNVLEAVREEAPRRARPARGLGRGVRRRRAELPVTEDAPLRPQSPYAAVEGGRATCSARCTRTPAGSHVVRTRAFNHAGPGPVGRLRGRARSRVRSRRPRPRASARSCCGPATPTRRATSPTCATSSPPTRSRSTAPPASTTSPPERAVTRARAGRDRARPDRDSSIRHEVDPARVRGHDVARGSRLGREAARGDRLAARDPARAERSPTRSSTGDARFAPRRHDAARPAAARPSRGSARPPASPPTRAAYELVRCERVRDRGHDRGPTAARTHTRPGSTRREQPRLARLLAPLQRARDAPSADRHSRRAGVAPGAPSSTPAPAAAGSTAALGAARLPRRGDRPHRRAGPADHAGVDRGARRARRSTRSCSGTCSSTCPTRRRRWHACASWLASGRRAARRPCPTSTRSRRGSPGRSGSTSTCRGTARTSPRAGVRALLARAGFEPVAVYHLVPEHNLHGMWLALLGRLGMTPGFPFHLLKRNVRARARDLVLLLVAGPLLLAAGARARAARRRAPARRHGRGRRAPLRTRRARAALA